MPGLASHKALEIIIQFQRTQCIDTKWLTLDEAIKDHVPAGGSGKEPWNLLAPSKISSETYFQIQFISFYFDKLCISISGSEDEAEEYIEEDQETETKCTQKSTRQIQQNILQELRTVVGGAQTLSEPAAKDLILQVKMWHTRCLDI